MTTDSDALQISEPVAEYLIDEPETVTRADAKPWLFKPGQSGNPNGRPKKGQSLPEKLRASIDRRADKIIDGQLTAAERGNTRAFVAAMSYAYGVPATKLIVQREDDPLTQWLMGMAAIEAVNDLPALPPPTTD